MNIDTATAVTDGNNQSCIALNEYSYIIQTKDYYGNNRYTVGVRPNFEIPFLALMIGHSKAE